MYFGSSPEVSSVSTEIDRGALGLLPQVLLVEALHRDLVEIELGAQPLEDVRLQVEHLHDLRIERLDLDAALGRHRQRAADDPLGALADELAALALVLQRHDRGRRLMRQLARSGDRRGRGERRGGRRKRRNRRRVCRRRRRKCGSASVGPGAGATGGIGDIGGGIVPPGRRFGRALGGRRRDRRHVARGAADREVRAARAAAHRARAAAHPAPDGGGPGRGAGGASGGGAGSAPMPPLLHRSVPVHRPITHPAAKPATHRAWASASARPRSDAAAVPRLPCRMQRDPDPAATSWSPTDRRLLRSRPRRHRR